MSAMDEYLDGLPQEQREALARVRAVVAGVAPEAQEGVSYGMPAFCTQGARYSGSGRRRST
jgi:uncharacterized protein YdhG (YjbR/CyaY superfamily)